MKTQSSPNTFECCCSFTPLATIIAPEESAASSGRGKYTAKASNLPDPLKLDATNMAVEVDPFLSRFNNYLDGLLTSDNTRQGPSLEKLS